MCVLWNNSISTVTHLLIPVLHNFVKKEKKAISPITSLNLIFLQEYFLVFINYKNTQKLLICCCFTQKNVLKWIFFRICLHFAIKDFCIFNCVQVLKMFLFLNFLYVSLCFFSSFFNFQNSCHILETICSQVGKIILFFLFFYL